MFLPVFSRFFFPLDVQAKEFVLLYDCAAV